MDYLYVLLVEPNKEPRTVKLRNQINSMMRVVGGSFDILPINKTEDVYIICNASGEFINLPINRKVAGVIIYGNYFVIGNDSAQGDFKSLTDCQLQKYKRMFAIRGNINAKQK